MRTAGMLKRHVRKDQDSPVRKQRLFNDLVFRF